MSRFQYEREVFYMKRFLALCITLTMCLMVTVSVSAAEVKNLENESEKINYLNYDFPDNAIVLYQSENGVVYQSKEELTPKIVSTKSTEYNYAWVDAGISKTGSFSITNPHYLGGTTNGTFKIESNYSGASGQMVLHNGVTLLANKTLSASDGDVHFSFNTIGSNLVITYYTGKISNSYGMRFMCWLW